MTNKKKYIYLILCKSSTLGRGRVVPFHFISEPFVFENVGVLNENGRSKKLVDRMNLIKKFIGDKRCFIVRGEGLKVYVYQDSYHIYMDFTRRTN